MEIQFFSSGKVAYPRSMSDVTSQMFGVRLATSPRETTVYVKERNVGCRMIEE
jgi:hypothetical protein